MADTINNFSQTLGTKPVPVQFADTRTSEVKLATFIVGAAYTFALLPWLLMLCLGALHNAVPAIPALSYGFAILARLAWAFLAGNAINPLHEFKVQK